jgi:hypothetical protein
MNIIEPHCTPILRKYNDILLSTGDAGLLLLFYDALLAADVMQRRMRNDGD